MTARVFTYIRIRHYKDGTVAKIEEPSVIEGALDFLGKPDREFSVEAEIAIPTIKNWNDRKYKCPIYGGVITYKVGKFDNGVPK